VLRNTREPASQLVAVEPKLSLVDGKKVLTSDLALLGLSPRR
jgi:hypothetical protein